jgi:hypothetical protein
LSRQLLAVVCALAALPADVMSTAATPSRPPMPSFALTEAVEHGFHSELTVRAPGLT